MWLELHSIQSARWLQLQERETVEFITALHMKKRVSFRIVWKMLNP